jgi:hypothetical protein
MACCHKNYDVYFQQSLHPKDIPSEGYRNKTALPHIDHDYSDFLDLGLQDVDWTDRMQITRSEINAFFEAESLKVQKEAAEWSTIPKTDECKQVSVLQSELHTFIAHAPTVSLEVLFGPTSVTKDFLIEEINGNFEHWKNAGDHSFVVVDLRWTNIVLSKA